ncbi:MULTISPECIES: cupredoxin domain-containing protein [Paenibacillus]|uniref:cupredoxin domain-containing protein n=1 Tax=Paenibacillus TaxID=44249 RepID=UPI000CF8737B|nr:MULTISPECIES: cupredoxin domain-containing protein [Paenibacillus]MBJ9993058.1 cupredoxin domain-containing protein [Paenibacillus sp. S28]MEC0179355.1 cupredoxin domain-containing protein [Paenibacillus favisporus]PQP88027.1 cytochrome C oxidase subunit II [Paenibacillus sp. AR247]
MKPKFRLIFMIALLSIVLVLSACGKSNNGTAAPPANNTAPSTGGGQTKEITVTAKNFAFDPPNIDLKAGDTVKLTFKNKDGVHGFEIPDLNVNLQDGQTATFTVDKAGTYDFNCSIQCGSGHDNMTGTITVS